MEQRLCRHKPTIITGCTQLSIPQHLGTWQDGHRAPVPSLGAGGHGHTNTSGCFRGAAGEGFGSWGQFCTLLKRWGVLIPAALKGAFEITPLKLTAHKAGQKVEENRI